MANRSELAQQVLAVLQHSTVPLYAREIADEVNRMGGRGSRTTVNQVLYGELQGRVEQTPDHRWSARGNGAHGHAPVQVAPRPATGESANGGPSHGVPVCPECGHPMRLRTARRGRNAGGQFWSCTRFPECRGTLDHTPGDAAVPRTQNGSAAYALPTEGPVTLPRPVAWHDASLDRPGWICRYAMAGGSLRSLPASREDLRPLATCWLARPDTGVHRPSATLARFSAVANKLLQRGMCPPLAPDAEQRLLQQAGLQELVAPAVAGDLAPRLLRQPPVSPKVLRGLWSIEELDVDQELMVDSDEERLFIAEWAPEHLDAATVRSIVPQAPLDGLALAAGLEQIGARRVDFLLQPPDRLPFVVEIDGEQHADEPEIDAARDELLAALGLEVVRVPAENMRRLVGPELDRIAALSRGEAARTDVGRSETLLAQGPALTHRAVLALVEAITAGLLHGDDWVIELEEPLGIIHELLPPYLDTLAAIDQMWAVDVMADRIAILSGGDSRRFERHGARYAEIDEPAPTSPNLAIVLEPERSPIEGLGPPPRVPTVVIRSAFLPARVADPFLEVSQRENVAADGELVADSLEVLLRAIFAKEAFRDGQLEALIEVVEGRSCAVLLPTGAGKSLIYQLAGLVLPGRTVIVDPIVALMEDQVRGLAAEGIDRVAAVSAHTNETVGRDELLELVATGDALFVFVTPERLQQSRFREALRSLAQRAPVNIAVVDEAHCVSEWGHDFRTAYLNLGRILREHLASGADDAGPPILALTGTASRAVLRDVLIELDIERDSDRAVIQPSTFDRPELNYEIVAEHPSTAVAALTGVVSALPAQFGLPQTAFFRPRGEHTMSGIIFCPWVNGSYGVRTVAEELSKALHIDVPFYAGGPPRGFRRHGWERTKRKHAEDFKANRSPLLVSTKAFGMGIDKPNVRYIVHLGIPTSIEAYYQEVGRAGRDRNRAECVLVTTEYDEQRARRLLDDDRDLELVREENKGVTLTAGDDVTRMLFFLLNSFIGEETELGTIEELLGEFGSRIGRPETVWIPMPTEEEHRRRTEKGLHRLVVLGVLRDYLVDWGAQKFQLELANCTQRSALEALLAYVRRSQPGQADVIERELAAVETLNLSTAIHRCAQRLIRFVYDTVERSRRRSLREMWLAARESRSDPNGAFRRRILDYLTQGSIAPVLERLVDAERVVLDDWTQLLDDVWASVRAGDRQAAAELRGGTGRLLASYPDHPGLLVARGASELLVEDGEIEELVSSLRAARAAGGRYGLGEDDFVGLGGRLVERFRGLARSGALSAVAVALGVKQLSLIGISPDDASRESALCVLALTNGFESTRDALAALWPALTDLDESRSAHGDA